MVVKQQTQDQRSFFDKFFGSSSPFKPSPAWMTLSYILLGIWTFIVLFPFYWLLVTAFKLPVDVNTGPKFMPYLDYQPDGHAWNYLLVESGNLVTRPYINTIVVGVVSSVLALLIGASASYALSRFEYRPKLGVVLSFIGGVAAASGLMAVAISVWVSIIVGFALFLLLAWSVGRRWEMTLANNDIAFWIISQRMLPPVAVIIPIYLLFQQLGLLDTKIALIITYTTINLPLVIWFMRDYFKGIPLELEESAFIDGASRYQVLWKIILPLSVPGLVATFLIVLVFAWNEYVLALFLSSADAQTMPLLVAAQNATRGPQWWNISVLVLLMVGPIVLMAIFLERFIARGLLVGAVKG